MSSYIFYQPASNNNSNLVEKKELHDKKNKKNKAIIHFCFVDS